jgi:hypothetical protein
MSWTNDTDPAAASEGERSHLLRRPLDEAVREVLASGDEVATVVEAVLRTLSAHRVIAYAPSGTVGILTPTGRVLTCLIERPGITLRELASYLGMAESNVAKSVGRLVKADVVVRTKVKTRNTYHLNLDEALKHPDIGRFYLAIHQAAAEALSGASDIRATGTSTA